MKACVIGLGSMGRNHVRVLSEMPDVELVGVVDSNEERCKSIAHFGRTRAFSLVEELLKHGRPDFAVIAVPTVAHAAVASLLIREKINVLIEKPISATLEEAQAIIDLAQAMNVKLSIGHVERFNPAVVELKRRLLANELGKVFHIELRRRGPFPAHVLDVGVALDLSVHDIDLARYLTAQEIVSVQHVAARRIHAVHEDFLRAQFQMSQGAFATLEIDWLTPTKIRDISITGETGMFRVDLLTQDLFFYENSAVDTTSWDRMSELRGIKEGRITKFVVNKSEPLRNELSSFVEAIRQNSAPPVSGEDGRQALLVAKQLALSQSTGI